METNKHAHDWSGHGKDCPQCQLENLGQSSDTFVCDRCHNKLSPLEVSTYDGDSLLCEACNGHLEAQAEALKEEDPNE